MTHETPAQRRTRLIEQYVPQLLKLCQGEVMPPADQLINWASRLADAVMAATPQEPKREAIVGFKTAQTTGLDGQAIKVPVAVTQQPEPTRYPSEIETRLHSALVDIARALERRCYRTATKKAKDALAKVPSSIFDV